MIYEFSLNTSKYYFDGNSLTLYKDSFSDVQEIPNFYQMPERTLGKALFLTTTNCNGNCVYCYEKGDYFGDISPIMSGKAADKALKYLQDKYDKISKVSFFGGEPILNFEVMKYIVEQLEANFTVGEYDIVTNGVLIDEEMIKFFVKYKFNITISVDGPRFIHDKLRINCLHDKVISVINQLKETEISDKVKLNCTLTKFHLDNLSKDELSAYFKSLEVEYNISNVGTEIDWLKLKDTQDKEKDIERHIDESYNRIYENAANKDISLFVKAVIESLLYGICFDEFCCELCKGFLETFDTDGNRHPCVSLIKYDIDSPLVKECNAKNNEVCNACWARNICRNCAAQYVLGKVERPYLTGNCQSKKYYEYSLRKIVEILEESEERFQLIIDNYQYFS